MGLYDRDYYRREGPSFLGSITSTGRICRTLIFVNVGVFILQILFNPTFTTIFQLDTVKVCEGQIWRLLTFAFLHTTDTWMHIFFNMLFLWWFGSDLEDLYGPREFLAFYLVSALLGGLMFQVAWAVGYGGSLCVGASGAVTAVLVLYALHYPTKTILLFFILPIPIWLFVIFQVAQDSFTFLRGEQTMVAVVVHLAGAGFAFAYYKGNWRWAGITTWFRSLGRQCPRPQLRVYREEPVHRAPVASIPPAGSDLDEHLEAKLDAILEKSLATDKAVSTEPERQVLMRASEVYKKRRN